MATRDLLEDLLLACNLPGRDRENLGAAFSAEEKMLTFDFNGAPRGSPEVFEHLKRCAKNLYTNTYKDICSDVKKRSGGSVSISPRGLGIQLSFVRKLCIAHQVPWINALAVNGKSWRPGSSFLPKNVDWRPSHEPLWRGMVLQVFAYDWSLVIVK